MGRGVATTPDVWIRAANSRSAHELGASLKQDGTDVNAALPGARAFQSLANWVHITSHVITIRERPNALGLRVVDRQQLAG